MITATARWSNPASTTASSRFRISAFNGSIGTIVDSASQMATSPYASPSALLNGTVNYNATTIPINSASAFSGSGYIIMEDALIGYGSNSVSQLNSASWFSGYGTYLPSTEIRQAHESYSVNTMDVEYVLFDVRHINNLMELSKASLITYYSGVNPGTAGNCNVIISALDQYMSQLNQFAVRTELIGGPYYSKSSGVLIINTDKTYYSSYDGICIIQCIASDSIEDADGNPPLGYNIRISKGQDSYVNYSDQIINVPFVPDMPYVLLRDIAE